MSTPAYTIPTTPYRMSGLLGYSPFAVAALALPILVLLSIAYAYICVYIPIAGYVTILILGGYSFALAVVLITIIKMGKCRSVRASKIYGLIGGAIALYSTWAFFVTALINRSTSESISGFTVLLHPQLLYALITEINSTGWYSIHKLTPSGWVLTIFWTIEAGIILGSAYFAAITALDNELFCEQCNAWCDISDTKYYTAEPVAFDQPIADISIEALPNLKPIAAKTLPCFSGEIMTCKKCQQFSGFRLSRVKEETDKEGKTSEKKETVSGILVS